MEVMKNNKLYSLLLLSIFFFSSSYAKDLEKVSLQLQWLDQFQFAGYYVAKEKGFYEDVGLEVEIKKFTKGISPTQEVIQKRATYGVGRSSLLINKDKGDAISILFATFQSSPLIFLTTRKSGISSVKDFHAKRIMMTENIGDIAALYALKNKFKLGDNSIVEQEHTFNLDDLVNGKTDLMTSYISNEPFLLKERGIESIVFDPKDYGFDFYSDLLFTTQEEIINHEQRTQLFTNASLKGWEYAFTNIEETVDLILRKYNTQNKSKKALLYEAKVLKKLAYYKIEKDELGRIEKDKIQKIYDLYNVMGLVKNNFDPYSFIFNDDKERIPDMTYEERAYIAEKKEIKMCVPPNSMPYSKIVDGKYTGMMSDYIEVIQKKLEIKFTLVPTLTFKDALSYVKLRKCDILSLTQEEKERKKYLNFTENIFEDHLVVITKNDKQFIINTENLYGKKIGVMAGYSYKKLLNKQHPKLTFVEVRGIEDGITKVRNDEIYGYLGSLGVIVYEIQHHSNDLKINSAYLDEIEVKMGVRDDDQILLNILNKVIKTIDSSEKRLIYNKWVHVVYANKINFVFIIEIISILLLIILFITYFLYKQNALRKELEKLNNTLEQRVQEELAKNTLKDKKLLDQSRFAQMGEMISMIAHQWRQPLGAISLIMANISVKYDLKSFDLNTKDGQENQEKYVLERIARVDALVERLSVTIDDFRNFYKPNKEKVELSLQEVSEKSLDIIETSLVYDKIELIREYHSFDKLYLYDSEIMQVLLNIFKNAQDNFKERKIKNPFIRIRTHEKQIFISDNGGGIDDDVLEKIFDPYFSTKNEKNGTGLGLYMSKIIVEDHHNAKINARNEGDGVCFIIEF